MVANLLKVLIFGFIVTVLVETEPDNSVYSLLDHTLFMSEFIRLKDLLTHCLRTLSIKHIMISDSIYLVAFKCIAKWLVSRLDNFVNFKYDCGKGLLIMHNDVRNSHQRCY